MLLVRAPGLPGTAPEPQPVWAADPESLVVTLGTDLSAGLSANEARRRLSVFGPNSIRKRQSRSVTSILVDQFRSLIVLLLVGAGAVAFAFGHIVDTVAIVAVIVINAAIGFTTELRAVRSMESLRNLGVAPARVTRDGHQSIVPAESLVPGDILVLEAGDVIPADTRIISCSRLAVDESVLTGESLPVAKSPEAVESRAAVHDRSSMLFKGTAVTDGTGIAVVTGTGHETEVGQIAELVSSADAGRTPLEKRLNALGNRLIALSLGIIVVLVAAGTIRGVSFYEMIQTGIALAVATIPEGLPIVATVALAAGLNRMAKRNALVNRLSAVETLGSTHVICSDKTGTLTENRLTVSEVAVASDAEIVDHRLPFTSASEDPVIKRLLMVGILCNNARLNEDDAYAGDPLEVALLDAAVNTGFDVGQTRATNPREAEAAFDSTSKMMATFHRSDDKYFAAIKGAPEAVLAGCSFEMNSGRVIELTTRRRREWMEHTAAAAGRGNRMIAVATRQVDNLPEHPYEGLTLIGLIAFTDPPRAGVEDVVEACRHAGVEVKLVTGDHALTAQSVARTVGILSTTDGEAAVAVGTDDEIRIALDSRELAASLSSKKVFARIVPRQKLQLVEMLQKQNLVVAMTGDGVNDAPALRQADIGIAMGARGTQVARESADIVLRDDMLATIVAAIEEGRIIFRNIRTFVVYLLSCNVAEILIVGLATTTGAPLPLLPLQILFLNLLTDVFPALALGVGRESAGVMQQPPRPADEPVLTAAHWSRIGVFSIAIAIGVLGALATARLVLHMPVETSITVSFLTLALSQLWHVFNMRSAGEGLFRSTVTRNPWVWGALVLCTLLMVTAVYFPPLASVLQVVDPGLSGWAVIGLFSLSPLALGSTFAKLLTLRSREDERPT